jgi:plastocyanin
MHCVIGRARWHSAILLATLLGWLPTASPSRAATNVVRMGNYFFNPTNLTINAGDSVLWTNVSLTAHDATGPANLWASPTLPFRGSYLFRFTNSGSYPYICLLHIAARPEQTGTVTVVSLVNMPPAVALTSPTNGESYLAPANLLLEATASDLGGGVSQVEFFNGDVSLGVDISSPYSVTVNDLPSGSYTLSAIALDNEGATATNSVTISVTNSPPAPVTLQNPRWVGGEFIFGFSSKSGITYDVLRANSLPPSNWTLVTTVIGNGGEVWVTNRNPIGTAAYYRVESR